MTGRRRAALFVVALGIAGAILLKGCSTLPSLANRSPSHAILDTDATRLGRAISPLIAAHSPSSGIYPLRDARDAFAARALLAQAAERTLDVQYYIWRKDMSGTLLFNALHTAADRGVRVRLLLDDNNTSGLDATLAALDSHPNIEVRLFNPFIVRKPRAIGYLTDFPRLNRRMHNKSFTVDNQVTIVGGRNVGDEYFGATDAVLFADLDVMAVGPVVHEVSSEFDRYWASDSSYPLERLVPHAGPDAITQLAAEASRVEHDSAAVAYLNAMHSLAFVRELVEHRLPLEWVTARMISDDPAKGLGRVASRDLLIEKFKTIFGAPKHELNLVSPYFVPGSTGVDLFRGWIERGVTVRVLTNSLEATDVAAVHAGYAKRRKALLAAGITLYELRRSSGPTRIRNTGPMGSSGSSLHAKTFAIDGLRVFVGSFNFDPRSAKLNTEMGFVMESPGLARQVENTFASSIPINAYEVRLSDQGDLYWIERRHGELIRHDKEPGTTLWQRVAVWFLSRLPIEWLL